MTIADKTVLVTGANRGIGAALVEEALHRGAKRVYAGARQPLTHGDGRVTPLTLDVTNAAQIQRAVDEVDSLDILINNAGVALYDDLTDRAVLERHLAVNLFGAYGVTQAFLPLLTRSRGSHRQQPVGERLSTLAAHPGLFDLQGGRVLPDAIAARPPGRTGRARSCRPDRTRGHRYDPRPRHTKGLSGHRRARHLRRSGQRAGGDLPRSDVGVPGAELAQRCGQGTRASVRGAPRRRARQVEGAGNG